MVRKPKVDKKRSAAAKKGWVARKKNARKDNQKISKKYKVAAKDGKIINKENKKK